MYELGLWARSIPDMGFSIIGIYMAHSFYKTPRRWWQCVAAWGICLLFCSIFGTMFAEILSGVTVERCNMFVGFSGIFVYIYLFSNIPWQQRLFTYFMIDNIMYLLVLVARSMAMLLVNITDVSADALVISIYCVLTVAFTLAFTFRLKSAILNSIRFFEKNLSGLTFFAMICYISTLLAIDVWNPWPALSVGQFLARVAILMINLGGYGLCFRTLSIISQRMEAESKAENMRLQLNMSKRYYDSIAERIEQTRQMNHDLKHHIRVLEGLCSDRQWERLEDYISTMDDTISQRTISNYCSMYEANVLLAYYASMCEHESISFSCQTQIPSDLEIEPLHICVILGNALQNALEACEHVEDGEKFIDVKARIADERIIINIRNSFNGKLEANQTTGGLKTTKKEANHGIGLESIVDTAQIHNGWVDFSHEDKVFSICVVLEIK